MTTNYFKSFENTGESVSVTIQVDAEQVAKAMAVEGYAVDFTVTEYIHQLVNYELHQIARGVKNDRTEPGV